MNKHAVFSILFFVALSLVAMHIDITPILGSGGKVSFTFFQFLAPSISAFIGPFLAFAAILISEGINLILWGTVSTASLIHLLPMLFAALYFYYYDSGSKLSTLLPVASILLFILHPIGAKVWYFTLIWFIPIILYYLPFKHLLLRSLGSTLAAHSIGGALWIWAFSPPASFWNFLIPVVLVERVLFALGISASYLAFNTLFHYAKERLGMLDYVFTDGRYVLSVSKKKE